MERKSKGKGYKMKGHTLPGINQNPESSALQYRAPQANQALVMGEREASKTSGGSVFGQTVQNMAENFKATKDMAKELALKAATGGMA